MAIEEVDEKVAGPSICSSRLSKDGAPAFPVEIENSSVFADLTIWGYLELSVIFVFGVMYYLLLPFIAPAEYALQRLRSRVRSSVRCDTRPSSPDGSACRRLVPGMELNRREVEVPRGVVGSASMGSKQRRTYVTRVLDQLKDVPRAGAVLGSGFAMDPFTRFICSNDSNLQHNFGSTLYSHLLQSAAHQTFVVEWEEQEKLIGVCVVRGLTRLSNQSLIFPLNCLPTLVKLQLIDYMDYVKWLAILIPIGIQHPLKALHLYKCLAAMARRAERVVPTGVPLLMVKFLATEKGFQGQGVGTDLLRAIYKIHDELTPAVHRKVSYIESSNIDNVPLYERFKFKTFAQWHATPQAPPLFLMIRPAVVSTSPPASTSIMPTPFLDTQKTLPLRRRGDSGVDSSAGGAGAAVVTTPRPQGDSVVVSSNSTIDKPSISSESGVAEFGK